jgi:hypothetical protein
LFTLLSREGQIAARIFRCDERKEQDAGGPALLASAADPDDREAFSTRVPSVRADEPE